MDVRNLGITVSESLQSDLIDKPTRAYPFDLLENRARAGVIFEPGMFATAPAKIFLHDAMHHRRIAALELEGYRQDNIALLVENAGVVPELHIVPVDGRAPAIVGKNLCRFKHFCDEHRSLACRSWRKEVQILPYRPAYGARDSNVVLQS